MRVEKHPILQEERKTCKIQISAPGDSLEKLQKTTTALLC